jgi:hypothetical protein
MSYHERLTQAMKVPQHQHQHQHQLSQATATATACGASSFYREQIEKWNKAFLHHNAKKIVLYDKKLSFDGIVAASKEHEKGNSCQITDQLHQENLKLLKSQLCNEIDSFDWMFTISNQNNINRASAFMFPR